MLRLPSPPNAEDAGADHDRSFCPTWLPQFIKHQLVHATLPHSTHRLHVLAIMHYVFGILLLSLLAAAGDRNVILAGSSGIPAMHATLLPDGTVMFLDKIENRSQLFLPDGRKAYSSIYDPHTHSLTALEVQTNPFCCGGSFLADGRVISVGGNGPLLHEDASIGDGFDGLRYLDAGTQAWSEPGNKLASKR